MTTLRQWADSGILLNDRGRPIQRTRLIDDVVGAFENQDLHQRIFICPRRSGKSSATALLASWNLLFREQSFTCWIAGTGGSAESIVQQKLSIPLRKRFSQLDLNIARNRIENKEIGSVVEILAPSESGVPGRTIDLLVLDEARHIPVGVVETLMPSAMGGKVFIISSAGRPSGWLFDSVMQPNDNDFVKIYRSAEEIQNPEFSVKFRDQEKARLTKRGTIGDLIFSREWQSVFVELSENPFLNPEDIRKCSRPKVEPYDPTTDTVTIGCDLSLKKDLTSLVAVAAKRGAGSLRVIEVEVLDPKSFGAEGIPLELVSRRIELMARKFRARVYIDKWQAALMVDQLRRKGIKIRAVPVTAALNTEAFGTLSELVHEHRLQWKMQARLEQELHSLSYQESQSGHLKVVDGDRKFHRDLSWSLALAVFEASKGNYKFNREVGFSPVPESDFKSSLSIEFNRPDLEVAQKSKVEQNKIRQLEVRFNESVRKLVRSSSRIG